MLKSMNKLHFFRKTFGQFKKNTYLCIRFQNQTKTTSVMTKETSNIIKSITASQKAYREHLINLVFDLIDSALNRHNEPKGRIFLGTKLMLIEKKVRGCNLASTNVNVTQHIYYDKESHEILVEGESADYDDIIIGSFSTMPIGMVEEVVKAIIDTAKSE